MSNFIYSNNHFFERGLRSLLGDLFIQDFIIIIDFDSITAENINKNNNDNKDIIGFVSNDLSYYKAEEAGFKIIIDANASLIDILSFFLYNTKEALYKPRWKQKLTHRERQLLSLVSAGMTLDEISRTLSVKPTTVYAIRRNLMIKIGCRNRIAFYNNVKIIHN